MKGKGRLSKLEPTDDVFNGVTDPRVIIDLCARIAGDAVELSEITGWSKNAINSWRSGHNQVRWTRVMDCLNAVGYTVEIKKAR